MRVVVGGSGAVVSGTAVVVSGSAVVVGGIAFCGGSEFSVFTLAASLSAAPVRAWDHGCLWCEV